jgi:hypothetical protein
MKENMAAFVSACARKPEHVVIKTFRPIQVIDIEARFQNVLDLHGTISGNAATRKRLTGGHPCAESSPRAY